MISTIWEKAKQHRIERGKDIALEVRMNPSVFRDCLDCDYNEVITAFEMRTTEQPNKMFGYPLVIDFDLDEGEWHVQSPRV